MKNRWTIVFAVLAIVFAALFIHATYSTNLNYLPFNLVDKQGAEGFNSAGNQLPTHAIKLPTKLEFAGEPVPLQDAEVRERLDREVLVNTYWQSSTILMLKRANRWFPTIEKILRENGVPEDFKYLALIESGLMDVVSPSGATGFWQFLKTTGQQYGLLINAEVDERYHVEKSTIAACKYLIAAKEKTGSWTNAAGSYNVGINGITNQFDRQGETNYYNILLNSETSRYVFRILALKLIHQNPEDFGYVLSKEDMYQPFDYKIVTVTGSVPSLAEFAKNNGITYKELKMLNSWLREASLSNSERRTYEIKVLNKSS